MLYCSTRPCGKRSLSAVKTIILLLFFCRPNSCKGLYRTQNIFTCSLSSMKSITADTETCQISKCLPCKAEDWENNHKQVRVCLGVRSMARIITFPTERPFPDKITIRFSPRPLYINFFLLDNMAPSWKPYTLALKPTSADQNMDAYYICFPYW